MIQPLEWREGTQCPIFSEWIAETPFGRFRLITTGKQFMLAETPWGRKAPSRFATVADGQRWAEKEWEKRVNQCLVSAVPTTASEE